MSSVGLASRQSINEYLPEDRSGVTQDEKWASPESLDMDVALFVSPLRIPVSIANHCPNETVNGDSVTKMWQGQPPYGGTFATGATIPSIQQFLSWRLPPNRRTRVDGCVASDWLMAMQQAAGAKVVNYTSDSNQNNSCGVPAAVWLNTTCRAVDDLASNNQNSYRRYCNKELFPSNLLTFNVNTPVNGKWVMNEEREAMIYRPEWLLDFELDFYFMYDPLADAAEKDFGRKKPPGGDFVSVSDPVICGALQQTAPCVQQQLFAGKLDFRGQQSGDNAETVANGGVGLHQLPASDPALMTSLEVVIDIEATVQVVKRANPQLWPKDEAFLRRILNCNVAGNASTADMDWCVDHGIRNPVFPYNVDLQGALSEVTIASDSALSLMPGIVYTIDVTISIQPMYVSGFWANIPALDDSHIATWQIETPKVKVTQQKLGFNMRNQGQVRVRLTVDSQARRLQTKNVKALFDLLTDAGSWAGLFGLAAITTGAYLYVLSPWGKLTARDEYDLKQDRVVKSEKEISKNREEAVDWIATRLEEIHGKRIDRMKVRRKIVEATSTVGRLRKTPLKDLVQDADYKEQANLPDHILAIIEEATKPFQRLAGDEDWNAELLEAAAAACLSPRSVTSMQGGLA